VNSRTIQRTRSDEWRSSITTCSAAAASTVTEDPYASTVTAPLPTLVVRLGGGVGAGFVLAQAAPPEPDRLAQPRLPAVLAQPEHLRAPPEMSAPPAPQEEEAPENSPSHNNRIGLVSNNRIELIIDSLPNHELVESIPIAIDALGDSVFTASMRNVDIAATGNSVGEALLLLKEHIAATFDELNRQLSHLTQDQKTTLQLLHTYIAPLHKKSRWL
jgi:hypothetical protein